MQLERQEENKEVEAEAGTSAEAIKAKEEGAGDDDAVTTIGSINPVNDFKAMINDRKTDRV